ncbi:MAG: hypothetical protein HRT89_21655 [Lentisphaeria bacterium]|nr:hypothetical protein [Lentisphaeria bacterium]NQZ70668.1 hypothetical protein [Lentisphaeria bacterium]
MGFKEILALVVYEVYTYDGAGEIQSILSYTSRVQANERYSDSPGAKQLWELTGGSRILLRDSRFANKLKQTRITALDDHVALKIKI